MEKNNIYNDISTRTGGEIYIGVVGPVRTGKSTFITKFMENFVVPNISDKMQKQIATDEMPQSADGKTIMTTQIKFVPANAVKVKFKNKSTAMVRLVDCVGYITDGASGHLDEGKPRMVKTPWFEKEIPFEEAAEIGTTKVIKDYSTIGVLVTTDGSFGDISRESFKKTEEITALKLQECGKPFIILLNSANPTGDLALKTVEYLENKYKVSVVCVNASSLTSEDIAYIMEKVLLEFPMGEINIDIPAWLQALPVDSKIINDVLSEVKNTCQDMRKMKDFNMLTNVFENSNDFDKLELNELNMGVGAVEYSLRPKQELFYKVISEQSGEQIDDDYQLISFINSFAKEKRKFDAIKDALVDAEENGYGIVMPTLEEMNLEQPVLVKKKGGYGVKLKANAPTLHIMKVDVSTEVSPIVGNEKQGKDMVDYIVDKFDENPSGVLEANMFGKSLRDIVGEGLYGKANGMSKDVQQKMRRTVTRIVNESKGGVICILL